MSEWEDFTESPAVRAAAGSRSNGPGVTPDDIDMCQIYDAFTPMVLLSLEGLGFCKKGEGGPFVEDGKLRARRRAPDEHRRRRSLALPSRACAACSCSSRRCASSAAKPHGRQVENAQLACVNGTGGWFSSASTVILGVD